MEVSSQTDGRRVLNHLFSIPDLAEECREAFPAGGFGNGHFTHTASGDFRRWRLYPGLPERDMPVPADQFHLWLRQGRQRSAWTLNTGDAVSYAWGWNRPFTVRQRRLFPFTWTAFSLDTEPPSAAPLLHLESLAFSPLLPGALREASLPVYLVVWRAHNPADRATEAALMLTWACGWPDLLPGATFDFQHDNLCLTGSLGDPAQWNRVGIAVPDLHYAGIYLQGIEPWDVHSDGAEIWKDFAEDGELDPSFARATPQGAAAWVKFDLDPGETKEIPFVLCWHFPLFESGPAKRGQRRETQALPRFYTQFLGKRRPDNAVVWLAEQAVENYGTEAATYRHWIKQIEDWQASILQNSILSDEEQRRGFHGLAALLEADTIWTEDGRFDLLPTERMPAERLRASLADAGPLVQAWPDIARQLTACAF